VRNTVGEINVPEHNWKAWPSVPKASTVPTLLKVLLVSGKPFVTARTGTGDELATRSKTASSELILFLFGIIGIPFYISTFFFLKILAFRAFEIKSVNT
jgi:hypothetical protein